MQTGYANTFVPFRKDVLRDFRAGDYSTALERLKMINRFQWLNMIDSFNMAEEMWSDSAYSAEEIVSEWIDDTGVNLCR